MMRHLFSRLMEAGRSADIRKKPAKPNPMIEVDKVLAKEPPRPLEKAPVVPNKPLPPITHPVRKTGKAGIDLMHEFEGLHKVRSDGKVEAYLCPAKVWTIGWGATGADPFNGGKIGRGTVWTKAQCDTRFQQHLAQFEKAVLDAIGKSPTSQAQFDAMVCLTYNIGAAAFTRSTVLRKHNAGDFPGAAKAFLMWNKAGGKVLRGLTRRRESEAALYLSGS
jgi:GH24 family phage-related lysozyme (muramidase)